MDALIPQDPAREVGKSERDEELAARVVSLEFDNGQLREQLASLRSGTSSELVMDTPRVGYWSRESRANEPFRRSA